jgi:hypothetical protein
MYVDMSGKSGMDELRVTIVIPNIAKSIATLYFSK